MRKLVINDQFIAYNHLIHKKNNQITVIFCHGFRSDMQGEKALFLEKYCQAKEVDFVRFDYLGHGQSSGNFLEYTLSNGLRSLKYMIEYVQTPKIVLVGSSMGGWLALLALHHCKERIAGVMGIAAAPDFTEKLIWNKLSEEQKNELSTHKSILLNGDKISLDLIFDARNHLLLSRPLKTDIPITLLHGMRDEVVPYEYSLRLNDLIASGNMRTLLIKDGDHRLNRESDKSLIAMMLGEMLTILYLQKDT